MYATLHGILLDKSSSTVIIDCHGVGYEVTIPLTTFQRLPEVGSFCFLFTHLRVLEDSHTLYGFAHACEKKIFQELLKLNKVGPKIALAVLGMYDYREVLTIISNRDHKALERVPGIGKTSAERMTIELHNKLNSLVESANFGQQQMKQIIAAYRSLANNPNAPKAQTPNNNLEPELNFVTTATSDNDDITQSLNPEYKVKQDALGALESLGLKMAEAEAIIKKIYTPEMTVAEVIKASLDLYKEKLTKKTK